MKKTVLIAEESATVMKMHKLIVSNLGFDVIEVKSSGGVGLQVVSLVKNYQAGVSRSNCLDINVILLPCVMSDIDGPNTTQQLRRLGYNGIIVAVSSSTCAIDIGRFLGSGADCHIIKPLTAAKLLTALKGSRLWIPLTKLARETILLMLENLSGRNFDEKPVGEYVKRIHSRTQHPTPVLLEETPVTRFRAKCFKGKEILEVRILLLDESFKCRSSIHSILCDFGHTVIEADCGIVGLNLVRNSITAEKYGASRSGYDIIIVGSGLNGVSSSSIVEQIRQVGYLGLIFGLTERSDMDANSRCLRDSGADAVLCKPIGSNTISECVKGETLFPLCFV